MIEVVDSNPTVVALFQAASTPTSSSSSSSSMAAEAAMSDGVGGVGVMQQLSPMSAAEGFRVQKGVLCTWINFKISPRHKCFVSNLFTDLGDGVILKHLLEVKREDEQAFAVW
jgi:hypothetical protein